jgi:hypothetical protein
MTDLRFTPYAALLLRLALGTMFLGDCREIGGASSQSHFGVRLDIGFEELTVAGTPNLAAVP